LSENGSANGHKFQCRLNRDSNSIGCKAETPWKHSEVAETAYFMVRWSCWYGV